MFDFYFEFAKFDSFQSLDKKNFFKNSFQSLDKKFKKKFISELGQHSADKLIQQIRDLQNLAYQLGLEEGSFFEHFCLKFFLF